MTTVEFRCMIQDIVGNEIYMKEDGKFGDRTVFYCITIPGENEWVRARGKNEFMTQCQSHSDSSTSIDEQDDPEREKLNRLSFTLVNWSYPIPSDGKNRSCLIKVYELGLAEHLRVNDIVQVGGEIEEDDEPSLAANHHPQNGSEQTNKSSQQTTTATKTNGNTSTLAATNGAGDPNHALINHFHDGNDFEPASDFPHSLVPRIQVKTLRKLSHINPLFPDAITRDIVDVNKVRIARARLSTILTQLFGGDTLASEYLILSLISKIHRRKDVTTLGQLTIGLSGIKPEMRCLIDKIYEIIAKITTHSHFIDLSIANLNNLRFRPNKDHDNNKMIAGTLQLPDGLFLMLNETALSEGQLTVQGTENLNTLNQVIRWQRLNYNFKFHSVEIDTDLKVLVFSEGKSLLSVPYDVRLEKNDPETISSIRQACEAVDEFLTEDLLNMFRYFITALKDVPEYCIPDHVQKSIQEDFVNKRTRDEANHRVLFSADDLSSYMTLARYVTISRGETVLTNEIWQETCEMESTRQSRLVPKMKQ